MSDWHNTIQSPSIIREDDTIIIKRLNHLKASSDFIRVMRDGICKGYKSFYVEVDANSFFPNAMTPIAGIMEIYKNVYGCEFEISPRISLQIQNSQIFAPKTYQKTNNVLNKVWKFNDTSEVCFLVDSYIEELQKSALFYKGLLNTIEWSLNEVMDNVIQHSKISCGYVMGQIHPTTKNIAFTIFDAGQGILNSFSGSQYSPRTNTDAITLAIKEEVTRDNKIGQGNGLFGLHSIIKKGKGTLTIVSGDGSYSYATGNIITHQRLPYVSRENACTTIDFQMNYSQDMSLDKSLLFKGNTNPYQIVSLRLEKYENDYGDLIYSIKEHSEGTGTRQAALRVKNEIINIIREEQKPIVLDFSGVNVISSSFADELLAKLLLNLGLFQFNNLIKLKNMDEELQKILHKSVIQRLVQSIQNQEEI